MKLHRIGTTLTLALAASLTLSACGDDSPTEGGGSDAESEDSGSEGGDMSGSLPASGASSQNSAMTAWIAGYQDVQPDVTVTYDAIGSGGGRENFLAGAVDLAGSDAYLDEDEIEAATEVCGEGGALNLPVYISPIAVPYNLPGVDTLNLRPDVLAQIFDQQITTWDDESIAADNPDAELPDTDITVVNRSDESGTTENYMEYLSAAAPDSWSYEPADAWPVTGGEAAAQTTGVIQVVSGTEGSIGYADASAVGDLNTASIGVGEEFVEYSAEAAAKVVDASEPAETGVEGDLALEIARDTTESGAYPIVLVSYHIVCTEYDDAATADLVTNFVTYVASEDGQIAAAEAAGSAPISEDLRGQIESSLEMVNGG
ncbi:MAG: phosphate ABC transporter substrate-binding protein PstS [Ornithinimicrobium sp.]